MTLILAVTIMTILAGFFFYTALNREIHAHMQLRFTYYTMQNTIQPENYKKNKIKNTKTMQLLASLFYVFPYNKLTLIALMAG